MGDSDTQSDIYLILSAPGAAPGEIVKQFARSDKPLILGRAARSDDSANSLFTPKFRSDKTRVMSSKHALIEWWRDHVNLTDLHSTNGVRIFSASSGWHDCVPGGEYVIDNGDLIVFGRSVKDPEDDSVICEPLSLIAEYRSEPVVPLQAAGPGKCEAHESFAALERVPTVSPASKTTSHASVRDYSSEQRAAALSRYVECRKAKAAAKPAADAHASPKTGFGLSDADVCFEQDDAGAFGRDQEAVEDPAAVTAEEEVVDGDQPREAGSATHADPRRRRPGSASPRTIADPARSTEMPSGVVTPEPVLQQDHIPRLNSPVYLSENLEEVLVHSLRISQPASGESLAEPVLSPAPGVASTENGDIKPKTTLPSSHLPSPISSRGSPAAVAEAEVAFQAMKVESPERKPAIEVDSAVPAKVSASPAGREPEKFEADDDGASQQLEAEAGAHSEPHASDSDEGVSTRSYRKTQPDSSPERTTNALAEADYPVPFLAAHTVDDSASPMPFFAADAADEADHPMPFCANALDEDRYPILLEDGSSCDESSAEEEAAAASELDSGETDYENLSDSGGTTTEIQGSDSDDGSDVAATEEDDAEESEVESLEQAEAEEADLADWDEDGEEPSGDFSEEDDIFEVDREHQEDVEVDDFEDDAEHDCDVASVASCAGSESQKSEDTGCHSADDGKQTSGSELVGCSCALLSGTTSDDDEDEDHDEDEEGVEVKKVNPSFVWAASDFDTDSNKEHHDDAFSRASAESSSSLPLPRRKRRFDETDMADLPKDDDLLLGWERLFALREDDAEGGPDVEVVEITEGSLVAAGDEVATSNGGSAPKRRRLDVSFKTFSVGVLTGVVGTLAGLTALDSLLGPA
ncbi:hypothetical protein JCM8202_004369 [Rhodotorula sphaerocarpa]